MDDPVSTDDLYGKSQTPEKPMPLHYEETPIIEPVIQGSSSYAHVDPPSVKPVSPAPTMPTSPPAMQPKRSSGLLRGVGMVVLFVLLFGAGVWLSTVLRDYLPAGLPGFSTNQTSPQPTPRPTSTIAVSPTPAGPYATWKSYEVVSGTTKEAIAGISFKLPPEVLSPICDGSTCASQGTYLPGGTRFTIAPRGAGQMLVDFRGRVVADVGGREFTTTPTTVAGHPAVAFSGVFAGTTVGGYSFTQMRGVMIEVDDKLSLEVNHFTPAGVAADFASDDALFDNILTTVSFSGIFSGQKGEVILTPTATPKPVM